MICCKVYNGEQIKTDGGKVEMIELMIFLCGYGFNELIFGEIW
jgi:hypothetical protein